MLEVENESTVAASIGATWAAISGFENYRRWHPYVIIEGLAGLDEVVGYSFQARSPQAKRWTVEGQVTEFELERRLTISVGFRYLGLEETHSISPLANGVRIVHGLRFTGVLTVLGLPAIKRNLAKLLTVEDRCLVQHIAVGSGRKSVRHAVPHKRNSASK
ncbi:MAG: hypothetical protein EOO76_02970 [Novosphingobium sp.]|nr:MAG: hypothetical protein EOO76_02970 [Novosphingobium sp.]